MGGITIKWTFEEENFLRDNYSKYGSSYCSKMLNRSENAVIKKAIKMKIKWDRVKEIYFEENLKPIVNSSKTYTECLEKMNLRPAGGNFKVLKKYIKLYDINISHFEDTKERYERTLSKNFKKMELSEILIENSLYKNNNGLKSKLLKENLIEYMCVFCGNKGEWNGKKLVLQLDHKNGINNDNRLENLRILCPNCHSQTPTFCKKN